MRPLTIDRIETPLAPLWVLATGRGICSVRFDIGREKTLAEIPASPSRKALVPGGPLLRTAARQILEYLREERRAFSVRLDLMGFSVFERLVLKEVRAIPFGETRTYAHVAGRLRKPRDTRRVRNVLVRNPIPILIPCHRVVGAAGLGHYVGGRAIKERLIEMERGQMGLGFGG